MLACVVVLCMHAPRSTGEFKASVLPGWLRNSFLAWPVLNPSPALITCALQGFEKPSPIQVSRLSSICVFGVLQWLIVCS